MCLTCPFFQGWVSYRDTLTTCGLYFSFKIFFLLVYCKFHNPNSYHTRRAFVETFDLVLSRPEVLRLTFTKSDLNTPCDSCSYLISTKKSVRLGAFVG